MIGAAAMVVQGVSRSTRDLDLFPLARECLEAAFWNALRATSVEARVRKGDADDPLAGVVRVTAGGEHPLDVVVGRSSWQGPQDAWAIEQLLAGPDGAALTTQVDTAVTALPPESRSLWGRIRGAERG